MSDGLIARLEARLARLRSFLMSIRDDAPDHETARRIATVAIEVDDEEAART